MKYVGGFIYKKKTLRFYDSLADVYMICMYTCILDTYTGNNFTIFILFNFL